MRIRTESKPFVPTGMTLIFVLMASMLTLMGGAAVAPALPLISEAFPESSEMMVSLIITIPSLAIVLLGSLMGRIADKVGKVRTLLVSLIIFTIAGVSGFFLNSVEAILVGRFILGIGLGGISLTATALIAEYYTGASRVKVIGYQAAAMGVGVFILEFAGGTLAGIGWREPFLIYLIGLVILIGTILYIKEPTNNRINIESAPTEEKNRSNRTEVMICYLTIFLALFMMFLLPTKLPYYLMELGASSTVTGLFLGVSGVTQAILCVMYGRISNVLNRMRMLILAFFMIGVGFCMISLAGSPLMTIPGVIVASAGVGMITPTVVNWLATIVTAGTSGKIMGGYSAALNLGGFSSSIIMVPVLMVVAGYSQMYFVAGVAAVLIAVAYYALNIKTKKRFV